VGFAIPVDSAKAVADQLIRGEKPTHALLGVQIADTPEQQGALVESVTPGGPASEADLQPGDVITRLGDRPVRDATDLTAAVRSHRPGDEVEVTYVRDGDTRTTTATLASAS
jgi:putative serine protease PepD